MLTGKKTSSGTPESQSGERAAGVDSRYEPLWHRFCALRDSDRWQGLPTRQAAVVANMLELVAFARPGDYAGLHDLIVQHGHEWVARFQGGLDELLGPGAASEVETALIWRIGDEGHTHRLLTAAGMPEDEATDVAASCYGHMFWLLLRGMEPRGRTELPHTPQELRLLIKDGTIDEWRATLSVVADSPWAPYGERLAQLAEEAGLPVIAASLRDCRRVYQLRQEDRERHAIAREIRRRVALSGRTQRDFAAYVGTSPSRLSTYANGKVTPSAAMLLRIQRASRVLEERRRAAERDTKS